VHFECWGQEGERHGWHGICTPTCALLLASSLTMRSQDSSTGSQATMVGLYDHAEMWMPQ